MQMGEDFSFYSLTKRVLEGYFGGLNESQRRAVFHVDGPLLILAGAGSGKTAVLINRVENLILFGDAYKNGRRSGAAEEIEAMRHYLAGGEIDFPRLAQSIAVNPVKPWNILAITFTNKAAGELKTRLEQKLGAPAAADITACTFHSLCVRILRRECEVIGYPRSFTIYDSDDSQRVIKQCLKQADLNEKMFPPKQMQNAISSCKDKLIGPDDVSEGGDHASQQAIKVYKLYQKALRDSGAMDFDDLIFQTVRLFRNFPDILERWQKRFRYIMVDEYQDTSKAQFELIYLLAKAHKNLCVVGDDDQSIYKFRGATIENILSFEDIFGAETIRLEQNYRSTAHILDAANAVIANNTVRKGKNLWTASGKGEKIRVERVSDEEAESRLIADEILENVAGGARFSDHAILYRMNAQSGTIEQALARNAIPYRIIGGVRFYERKEIKDMIAYLTMLVNPADNLRLSRIINEPRRSIGTATVDAVRAIAEGLGLSMFEVLKEAERYEAIQKKKATLAVFVNIISELASLFEEDLPLDELLEAILERTGYRRMLEAEGFEGAGRMENILELKSILLRYQEENPDGELSGFLEEIALYTDLDNYDLNSDAAILMTIHSAKGLEFENVFLTGMEEGIFPGRSVMIYPPEVEEERRLCYVAITRAKKRLVLTNATKRMLFGQTTYNPPSRFIGELPAQAVEINDHTAQVVYRTGREQAKARALKRSTQLSGGGITVGTAPAKASKSDTFAPGDMVAHKAYGEGKVLGVKPMGGDTLLEINFFGAGIKKIMANYARLEKI